MIDDDMSLKAQKCSLQQISTLRDTLIDDEVLISKYDLTNAFLLLEDISVKQKNFILYCLFNNKRDKLNQVLLKLNFKPNQNAKN